MHVQAGRAVFARHAGVRVPCQGVCGPLSQNGSDAMAGCYGSARDRRFSSRSQLGMWRVWWAGGRHARQRGVKWCEMLHQIPEWQRRNRGVVGSEAGCRQEMASVRCRCHVLVGVVHR